MRAFVSVDRLKVHQVPNDVVLVRDAVACVWDGGGDANSQPPQSSTPWRQDHTRAARILPPSMSRAVRAMLSALPQLLRLTNEIMSGTILPASFKRATCKEARLPRLISVIMSASFICTSWLLRQAAHRTQG